jgi:hypothetical protein
MINFDWKSSYIERKKLKNSRNLLTECMMKCIGDRLIPLGLTEGKARRCDVILVLFVETKRIERSFSQTKTEKKSII